MLTLWQKVADSPEQCLIVGETGGALLSAKGLSINPHISFAGCSPLDYLHVPGGQGVRREVDNLRLPGFVAAQAKTCEAVLFVCTGAFVLHAAGLLSGKAVTTHWASLDRLRALGEVDVREQRFVRDRAVWSSAGVSAGMDLMLAPIASVADPETAGQAQLQAEDYPYVSLLRRGTAAGAGADLHQTPTCIRHP